MAVSGRMIRVPHHWSRVKQAGRPVTRGKRTMSSGGGGSGGVVPHGPRPVSGAPIRSEKARMNQQGARRFPGGGKEISEKKAGDRGWNRDAETSIRPPAERHGWRGGGAAHTGSRPGRGPWPRHRKGEKKSERAAVFSRVMAEDSGARVPHPGASPGQRRDQHLCGPSSGGIEGPRRLPTKLWAAAGFAVAAWAAQDCKHVRRSRPEDGRGQGPATCPPVVDKETAPRAATPSARPARPGPRRARPAGSPMAGGRASGRETFLFPPEVGFTDEDGGANGREGRLRSGAAHWRCDGGFQAFGVW